LLYECLDSHEPSEPVWTLDILTVEPTEQRGGIGSALVEHGLVLARGSRCASFLDTSRPELVGYYARFGFAVDSEADLPDGGPHLWFMVARA
jgi:predicted N-acetyltransferase YhbS